LRRPAPLLACLLAVAPASATRAADAATAPGATQPPAASQAPDTSQPAGGTPQAPNTPQAPRTSQDPGIIQPAGTGAPDQLVGLFIQGCLPFVGNAPALRDWARRTGLRGLPEPARAAFLHGAPGQAFDASAAEAKLVLVSSDSGLCSAVTNQATQAQVIAALEAGFRRAGVVFRLVIERDDASVSAIHDREYLATHNKQGWRILAATVKDDRAGGEAMLTAGPE
jgi:hypothetical protein